MKAQIDHIQYFYFIGDTKHLTIIIRKPKIKIVEISRRDKKSTLLLITPLFMRFLKKCA